MFITILISGSLRTIVFRKKFCVKLLQRTVRKSRKHTVIVYSPIVAISCSQNNSSISSQCLIYDYDSKLKLHDRDII